MVKFRRSADGKVLYGTFLQAAVARENEGDVYAVAGTGITYR